MAAAAVHGAADMLAPALISIPCRSV